MSSVLVAKNVSKSYGTKKALEGFSIEINKGEIVALLGPNGAGKTTFVKSVLGLLNIDSGELELFSCSTKNSRGRKALAYLPEKFKFYDYFTVEDTLDFYAHMYEVEKNDRDSVISNSLEKLGISDLKKNKLSTLSKGQMQRVGLACSIVGDQDFIILDEPFSGLDPIGIKDVKDLCLELKESGKTILINSHILSEMEKIADKAIIIKNGVIQESGSISQIAGDIGLEEKFYQIIKGK